MSEQVYVVTYFNRYHEDSFEVGGVYASEELAEEAAKNRECAEYPLDRYSVQKSEIATAMENAPWLPNDYMIAVDESGADQSRPGRKCVRCGGLIDGEVMIPEGEGAMDVECWKEWMEEQP